MEYLSKKIKELLKYRIEQEEASYRLYKAMYQYLDYIGYTGAAKVWKEYAEEELEHVEWVNKYLEDLDYLPPLPAIEEPQIEFEGLPDIIKKSLIHEQDILKQCEELAMTAMKENDFKTFNLAQKFVEEQVDEVSKLHMWNDKVETFGTSEIALKLLDNEMNNYKD